ncbi:MAG: NADH-quinone oxidoreductase subunit NuoH [Anaerolineae bacterium]|nr:NADH-quinone oxidoreductase subunit NuoH [Anaerolineae bacterium]
MGDIFTTIYNFLSGLLVGWGASPIVADAIIAFLAAAVLATCVLLILIFNIWLERKVLGRIQDRIGPNRVGPYGIFQTVADLLKLLTKEIIIPSGADLVPFFLAPIIMVASVILVWAVIPFTAKTIGTDVNIGVLYLAAVGSLGIMAVLLAGWSSNNKYALLGAFRAVAMLVSYEVPMILMLMMPVLITGSMRMGEIAAAQPIWYAFSMPLAAVIFLIAMTAEVGRSPFDLLEAESEIVAGYQTEYSGFAFAMFYAAEWAHAFTMAALIATLFLGGWRGPGAEQYPTLGFIYFIIKTYAVYFLSIWSRGTLPRIRIDQVMSFCWKFLIPLSLILIVLTTLADKIAQTVLMERFPDYMSTASLVDMLPRASILLAVNLVVGALAVWWIALLGRRERQRQEVAISHLAPVEVGTATK